MKIFIAKILFILFMFFIHACYTQVIDSNKPSNDLLIIPEDYIHPSIMNYEDYESITFLFQEWSHSKEEERDSVIIYRPRISGNFPSTRFREIIEFYKDGKFKYLYLDPNDAHYFRYGIWALNKKDSSIILLIYSQEKKNQIKLIKLSKNILSFVSF